MFTEWWPFWINWHEKRCLEGVERWTESEEEKNLPKHFLEKVKKHGWRSHKRQPPDLKKQGRNAHIQSAESTVRFLKRRNIDQGENHEHMYPFTFPARG
ncbi:hypothetical protein [Caldibacillus debilis]|uniref:hypothetical protein n=1 Tax=Caldibacillus debilis TaxID=301148 RepID=UPI00217D7A77|nr:hypothetical protein [Caldibacillus debilis]